MSSSILENIRSFKDSLPSSVVLVAVSKTKSAEQIMEAYEAGQRIFGENKIQEMEAKHKELPKDIQWHMIGHIQRNKVKYMASFVSLIHAVDSLKLLREIDKQAKKHNRSINCLLQIKIAEEESKFGMDEEEALVLLSSEEIREFKHVNVIGLMGMATFTSDTSKLDAEFGSLARFYETLKSTHNFSVLSMGMSGDYRQAIEHGSTMIRVGSAIFGAREY